jgi:hypothetical protein
VGDRFLREVEIRFDPAPERRRRYDVKDFSSNSLNFLFKRRRR